MKLQGKCELHHEFLVGLTRQDYEQLAHLNVVKFRFLSEWFLAGAKKGILAARSRARTPLMGTCE